VHKALVVALVVLVVFLGVPVLMAGMAMSVPCPHCDGFISGGHAGCLAVLPAMALIMARACRRRLLVGPSERPRLLLATVLDPPPRLV